MIIDATEEILFKREARMKREKDEDGEKKAMEGILMDEEAIFW